MQKNYKEEIKYVLLSCNIILDLHYSNYCFSLISPTWKSSEIFLLSNKKFQIFVTLKN